jgi:FkbM family methyltransferase
MKIVKEIIKNIMPHGLYVNLKKLKSGPKSRALDLKRYDGYKPAGGMGDKMQPYIDYVKNDTNIKVKNIFEIGANFAQDADYLMEQFDLAPNDIYVFEAHPEIYEAIKKIHNFNAFNKAVYNEEGEIEFTIFPLNHINTGWSSIFHGDGVGEKIKIGAIRMDAFMKEHNIEKIYFLKIDVEGGTYHVLDGFGERIKDINCVQLEAEHTGSGILYEKISKLLLKNDFELIHFYRNNHMVQSDSFWIKKEYIVTH